MARLLEFIPTVSCLTLNNLLLQLRVLYMSYSMGTTFQFAHSSIAGILYVKCKGIGKIHDLMLYILWRFDGETAQSTQMDGSLTVFLI